MDPNRPDDEGDKCKYNGDCSPQSVKSSLDLSNNKNIDDIYSPSDLKFDQGIVNNFF